MTNSSRYVCQQCGYSQVGWSGKCPECGSWGSLIETIVSTNSKSEAQNSRQYRSSKSQIQKLSDIKSSYTKRISTKISELDRVLGGGLVPGQVVLIAGEPGIGKSTILTQLADKLSVMGNRSSVLYVCGEESAGQVKIRAQRLGVKSKKISLLEETDVDNICEQLTVNGEQLAAVIVDSIQTMSTSDLKGLAGSVGQIRECTNRLLRMAKSLQVPLFLVGHVTKEGTMAGPAVLTHIVDTILWFEGDKSLTLRLLRAVKNRFGPTDEVGIFEMQDRGLVSQNDPEKLFLTSGRKAVAGSVVSSIVSGTRPFLVEIQSLVVPTKLAFPKRIAQGIDSKRLEMLLAVLIRRCGLPLYEWDVFVNVAGGIKVSEPAVDLAICLSIAGSYLDKTLPVKTIAVGEVGLLGEIREVVAQDKRTKEAKRLGFTNLITSKEVKYISEAINKFLRLG